MSSSSSAAIAATLASATAVTICCHVRPDADTIGSGLALGMALDRRGVDVEVSYPGTEQLPASLAGLPGGMGRLPLALAERLEGPVSPGEAVVTVGPFAEGLVAEDLKLVLASERDLTGNLEQWSAYLDAADVRLIGVEAAVGIVASLPLGILLALGRRSAMPAVRLSSVVFIEFVRGVPLITVLFMASVMLPLFVPDTWSPDKLLRALVGVALFSAAYMAEVVRAGLQAIPKGQIEAANALGLGYWRTMQLIVLPQALRITIPNIVNSTVALFKDTTLVFIVGIFDFLKTIEAARTDPAWATPVTSTTGYAFAAIFYLIFCYGMSRYAGMVEERLAQGDKR